MDNRKKYLTQPNSNPEAATNDRPAPVSFFERSLWLAAAQDTPGWTEAPIYEYSLTMVVRSVAGVAVNICLLAASVTAHSSLGMGCNGLMIINCII